MARRILRFRVADGRGDVHSFLHLSYAKGMPGCSPLTSSSLSGTCSLHPRTCLRSKCPFNGMKVSVYPFFQGLPGSMCKVLTPTACSQARTACAVNSDPYIGLNKLRHSPINE